MSVSPPVAARPELSRSDWKRLNRLLAQALEADVCERPGWLASLAQSDRDLLPVLEQLLDRAASTEAMVANRTGTGPGSRALRPEEPTGPAPAEEQAGTQIGPYRLLREIGRGGMGTVWLAERIDGVIERQVALKLPRAEWTDRGLADRMARERSVLASLNHPNIAQLYDAGWAGDGRPFLALERVEGEPIDAWCRRQRLATADCVRLFVEAVRAVAFAHSKLVIHRDIKPSNVLVTSEGRVKLLDFGIAKLLSADAALAEETALTRVSGRALTLSFAAPEQVLGQPISTAADTYSLGVMLYELLSGARPYRPERDSRGALEEAIVNVDPPAPSGVATDRAAASALRGDLDTIILKALRKRPEQRYETAAAFADDLERWLDGRPVRAQRSSGWYRARRFVARHRLGFVAGTVTTAALLAGGGIALWQSWTASEDAARADTARAFVLSIIAQADPAVSRETRDADLTLLTTAESRLARELGTHPALALELRLAIAQAYRNRGEFERARVTLRNAIMEARRVLPRDNLNVMRAWIRLADWKLGDNDDVLPELDAAVEKARALGQQGAQLLVEALTARAPLRRTKQGRTDAELADAREAHEVAVRYFGAGHPLTLAAAVQRTQTIAPSDEVATLIESEYEAALANPALSLGQVERIQIQSLYGLILCHRGQGRKGLQLLREAVDIARERHQSSLPTENALGALQAGLHGTGDERERLAVAKQAFALAAAREPAGSINRWARIHHALDAAILSRDLDEARALMPEYEARVAAAPSKRIEETVRLRIAVDVNKIWLLNLSGNTVDAERLGTGDLALAEEHRPPRLRMFRLALSYSLRQNGKISEAEQLLASATRDSSPEEINEDVELLSELAATRLQAGDAEAALSHADQALREIQPNRLVVDPFLSDLQLTRGQALLKLGRTEEALAAFRVSDEFWRSYEPRSHWAAEASYWVARVLIEAGDAATGKPMLTAARTRLAKSPMPLHRRLAAVTESTR